LDLRASLVLSNISAVTLKALDVALLDTSEENVQAFCRSCHVSRDGHFRIVYYSGIAELNPEYQILFSFPPRNALHLRIAKKTLFTQKPRRPAQRTFWHWKSTIYHFITQTIHFRNIEQQNF